MKGYARLALLILTVLIWVGCAHAASPKVVKSVPEDGAADVPVDLGKVVIVFDRNMKMNSWSLMVSPQGIFPPMIASDEPWFDPCTFELKVEQLKPGTTYAIQLNSDKRKGFQSAEDQRPLPVTTIAFRTSSQKAGGELHGSIPEGGGQSTLLSLYQEPYQGAFHILIPQGWKTEGGMIPSGVQWNVVDLVENNIRFRVTSPDGKSFFGWYPRFYFQDPAVLMQSSGGVLQPQVGSVLNGCWLYPFMDIAQYVQTIVFGQLSAQEFQNPRILGSPVQARELDPWIPRMASRAQAGYVNFQCSVNGVPSYGRIYAILYEIQGTIWSTVGTFGWVAPMDRWKQDARIMELSIRSFRLNPQWVQRAAAAERYRGQKYGEVIREMQRIDEDINRNHSQARSDMQEEFYKVITEQIETWDPESGRKEWLPMYNHAWTNGRGDYFVRDYDDGSLPVENPSEWRKLTIINRNDPNYSPQKYGE